MYRVRCSSEVRIASLPRKRHVAKQAVMQLSMLYPAFFGYAGSNG